MVSGFTRLTSDTGQEFFPSLSPDGEFVVYASEVTGNWDIYFKRVGGETALNLTANNLTDDIQPAFSPDGKRIVFRSERDGGGLFLMGATGESVKRLTDFGYDPAWSPDGRTVSCATQGITDNLSRLGRGQIWSVDVASGESKALTREEDDAVQSSWSPNGHRITFWSYTLTGSNHRDIWTIPAQGGKPIPITSDSHIDRSPVWSPDGRFLYFTSDRGGGMNIWRIPVDEESGEVLGPPTAVTTDPTAEAMHLDLSMDGKKLAYVAKVIESNLWKVAFDPVSSTVEGEPVPITNDTQQEDCPDISPDGQWIAYRTYGDQEDIGIMRIDGTDRRQLTNDVYFDRIPVWSPNGDRIAFSSNRGGSMEIWSIKPDGSGLTQLTRSLSSAITPSWSPDGQIACSAHNAAYIFDSGKPWDEQDPVKLQLRSHEGHVYRSYSWSPDGRWLAAHHRTSPGGVGVYSFESSKFMPLIDFGAFPRWTMDSRSLIVQEFQGGDLYMVDVDTGTSREVLSLAPDQLHLPTFSPDNRWIYFERLKAEADIWMLTLNEERE
jgi:Tol biopolymer transport system component